MHQDDEPQKTISIDRNVGAIAQGPQYNLQGGYFFEILLTGKHLRWSHWNSINMTNDIIEQYGTLNTKGCPEDLNFGDFNDQPTPSTYSDLTNYYDGNSTQINATLMDNKEVEYSVVTNDENNDNNNLASDIEPPNNILETEGVEKMGNENEERKIEGVDYETGGVDSYNEVVENEVLPPERKLYSLRKPLNVNYNDKRATRSSMGWNNLIFVSNELHSVEKAYINVVNAIASFVKPTPPTNIITNEIILTQYSINQVLKVFEKKSSLQYGKNFSSSMIAGLSNLINPKTSVINSREGACHI